ncbi:hypothetical protein, partial [Legionella pneumophila]|uniref:hypothetical protein n=1 Tax=Legionella pneumophila TaxID=446 RepID=UPI000AB4C5F4
PSGPANKIRGAIPKTSVTNYIGNIGNTLGPKRLHKLPRSSGLKNATSPYKLIIYITIHPPEF